ncbi:MAG: hypothetical protein KDD06_17030 [Phaeodactylibacter sp.]|nr:hypothetical protein [Phaeodactylibacter sp.]MCB9266796.1 hypothetical protein [Lewinellaceae bacterium]MCB9287686.1 hypothetical protein [Lewinellaceae bacterium]
MPYRQVQCTVDEIGAPLRPYVILLPEAPAPAENIQLPGRKQVAGIFRPGAPDSGAFQGFAGPCPVNGNGAEQENANAGIRLKSVLLLGVYQDTLLIL